MKYGPQTPAVETLLTRTRALTQEEAEALAEAWRAAWDAAQDAAWEAAWPAAQYVAQDSAWEAVRGEVWDATWVTARVTAQYAVWDAALALLVRDLIDESTAWNQKAFDILTGPWRSVIGPLPDDAAMNPQDKCRDCDQIATIYWIGPEHRWCKQHEPPPNWEPGRRTCTYPNCDCDDFKPRCPQCADSWPCPQTHPHTQDHA